MGKDNGLGPSEPIIFTKGPQNSPSLLLGQLTTTANIYMRDLERQGNRNPLLRYSARSERALEMNLVSSRRASRQQ